VKIDDGRDDLSVLVLLTCEELYQSPMKSLERFVTVLNMMTDIAAESIDDKAYKALIETLQSATAGIYFEELDVADEPKGEIH
jgi:hypothetical protein